MKKLLLILASLLIITPTFALNDSTQEYTHAEKYFDAGDYAMAERYYQQSLVKYRTIDNLAAYIQHQLAFCLRYQNKAEEAVSAYRKLKAEYPNSPLNKDAQEHIARTYYEAGDYGKAGPEFEKMAIDSENTVSAASGSVDNQQKSKEAYGYAAMCFKKSGKRIKAKNLMNKMMKENK